MTEHTQLTPRNRTLEAAQKEMMEFERREKAFRTQDQADRAAALGLLLDRIDVH